MYKKLALLFCLLAVMDIAYSTFADSSEKGPKLVPAHSAGVSDDTNHRTTIQLFNGAQNTADFTLTAKNENGVPLGVLGASGTSVMTGSLLPMGSFLVETNQTGPGLGSVFLTLESESDIVGWTREAQMTQDATVGMVTAPFIRERDLATEYLFSSFDLDPNTTTTRLGLSAFQTGSFSSLAPRAGASRAFTHTDLDALVEIYYPSGAQLSTRSFSIPPDTSLNVPFTSLFTATSGSYMMRIRGNYPFLPSVIYEDDQFMDKNLGASISGDFSTVLTTPRAVAFYQEVGLPLTTTVSVAQDGANSNSGILHADYDGMTSDTGFNYNVNGFSQTPSNIFVNPSMDAAGTVTVTSDNGRGTAQADIVELFDFQARATAQQSALLNDRLVFHLNGSLPYDTVFANSQLILHNHENGTAPISWATLDDAGNFLEFEHLNLAPGATSIPLDDLVLGNAATRVLLLEAFSPKQVTVDVVLYGQDDVNNYKLLDHVRGQEPGGSLSVSLIPRMYDFWGTDTTVGCLGNNVNVADILGFIERGYRCR